jgi:von Willebrand factor type A domain
VSSIPLVDSGELRFAARRTLVVRVVLGALLVGLVVAAVLVSRHPHTQTIVTLPPHSSAIVVLDVSASISQDTFSRIGATLSSLAHSNGRYGLVAFSDEAYEALPPGTPAADLQPLVRYFTLPEQKSPGFAATFPANPWQRVFTAGTKISAGLELAHQIALDDRLSKPVVILVSDLDDDPEDVIPLGTILAAYKRDHIPLRIVGLNPSAQNADFFSKLSGGAPITRAGTLGPGPQPRNHTPFPWTLLALALAVAVALAAHELWGPRLDWRTA